MQETNLISIGNSTGMILSKEVLALLNAKKGDTIFLSETPHGIVLTAYDPRVAEQVKQGEAFMREYRETFRALAE